MTGPGAPRPRGRHASPDDDARGVPASWTARPAPQAYGRRATDSAPRDRSDDDTAAWAPAPQHRRADVVAGAATTAAMRSVGGPGRRYAEETGPVPLEWRHSGDGPERPGPRRSGDDTPSGWRSAPDDAGRHPSAPLPPPPPGAWSRLSRRPDAPAGAAADAPTEAQPALPVPPSDESYELHDDEAPTDAHHVDPDAWADETGGLEVIGAHVDDAPRRGRRGRRRAEPREDHEDHYGDDVHDELHDGELFDEDIPVQPYDRRSGRRRRRRPVAVLLSLVVLAALVGGVFFGGQKLLGLFTAEDYTGQGTGSVDIRVQNGDTLSDIGRTLVEADVIASVSPFVDAAETEPDAMGITAGVYRLRHQMSGAAALDLLLDPAARLVSRVTIPEGLIVTETLQRIADTANLPIADLQAAAADPAALGLPAYANGSLEGFLFPATYDVEPGDTAADVLRGMVARTTQALDELGVPQDQRLTVLTKASLVQAEASSTEDMAKVAQVLENRLRISMPLQLDTTVNYANGKSGITTTPEDRANPSPYNTYLHPGLPPGPIGNPGEDAIRAVLNPTPGDWLFFVVVNPDSGETRFAVTAEEHNANVALFQQWLREHPGG
ncbi:endolytic transglycosylase MltG [Geodermatophilus sp. URMC 64]